MKKFIGLGKFFFTSSVLFVIIPGSSFGWFQQAQCGNVDGILTVVLNSAPWVSDHSGVLSNVILPY